jgi:hypothetical protein
VPKAAGGVNRRLDLALIRATELRKRHAEDIERLKRELPSAFVRDLPLFSVFTVGYVLTLFFFFFFPPLACGWP